MPNSTQESRAAFTLVELLVVISIILVASSLIFIGGSGGSGAALSSAQRIVSGVAQGARGQAIMKNANTRLIIHNDPSELDKYRRFFGIIYRVQDDEFGAEQWMAATQGTYLPNGIFFDAATSGAESGAGWSPGPNGMTIEYPRASPQPTTAGPQFLYYEFNSNGTSANANAYLVLAAGTMIPNAAGTAVDRIAVNEEDQGLRAGLIFRRAGTTTSVNEPSAVPPAGGSTSSEIQ